MIVVDTSALMAIVLDEPEAQRCRDALENAARIMISAGTVAESMIVSGRRQTEAAMSDLIIGFGIEVVPLTDEGALQAAAAYSLWGKGVHPARLNMGDCFAYALAKLENCPLLFVGADFSQTDIVAA